MKMPSIYTDLSFKQVFENATASRNSAAQLWTLRVETRGSQEGVYDS